MLELTIESSQGKNKKGRSFSATLLSYVVADSLWDSGSTDSAIRPVWMMLAGSDQQLRPFVANLQLGRKAEVEKDNHWRRGATRFEFLKSVGFRVAWQRTPLGSTVTIYLPGLFQLDPGLVDPDGAKFCILPDPEWLGDENEQVHEYLNQIGYVLEGEDIIALIRLAPLFIAYLDRRTRCPLIPDPRFYAQVLIGALTKGLASLSVPEGSYRDVWGRHRRFRFSEVGTNLVGLSPGIAFMSSHEDLEAFLAEEVKLYFDTVDLAIAAE